MLSLIFREGNGNIFQIIPRMTHSACIIEIAAQEIVRYGFKFNTTETKWI